MQLKEEFRTYEALRREHDAQIVQIATEAGLRIAPDQWSSLLYGDSAHKSHMQSIIDKLQTPQSFGQSVQELVIALQRTGDPHNLSSLRLSLELLAALDPCPDSLAPCWVDCQGALDAAQTVVRGLVEFVSSHGGNRSTSGRQSEPAHGSHGIKYKTSLCRDLLRGGCPRGTNCTFAHSEDELDKYRSRHRKNSGKLRNGDGSGSQENLLMADGGTITMVTDPADAAFYYSGAMISTTTPASCETPLNHAAALNRIGHNGPRSGFNPSSYPYRHPQYGPNVYPPPPPLPPNLYGSTPHLYGAPQQQPEYAMPAPITDYRPVETARLIPSLASQSLVVLQNRKQEILDQLDKIATVAPATVVGNNQQQQLQPYSMWTARVGGGGGAGVAQTKTTSSTAYNRTAGSAVAAVSHAEDDDFIPFGAPICSKYGPISRVGPRPSNPVQASASFGHSFISTPVKRTPLISTGAEWIEMEAPAGAPVPAPAARDFYVESERMKYELELLKQQIDELKMATCEATVLTEGRQRLSRELHLIEDNIREKERELRLTQRKRRNVANLPVNGKTAAEWDVKFFNCFEDDEDNGIANGMRELELRLQHELEEQE